MRRRLRTFFIVGLLTTVLDVVVLLVLAPRLPLVSAATIAVTLAAGFSYLANRLVTFSNDPAARWVRHPSTFALMAVTAGAVDVAVVVFLHWAGATLWAAKLTAVILAAGIRWVMYRWVLFTEVRQALSERTDQPPAPGELRLSVVVPAYNEAERIGTTLGELMAVLGPTFAPLEIVVVDDGSSDETAAVAEASGARVIRLGQNRGKGAAVRAGVMAARGRSIVFTDADLAYPPEAVADITRELESGWDIVVGSRRHQDTKTLVKAARVRELGGLAINALTHLVLLGHFRDTQCGIKGFRSDVGHSIFRRCRIDRFGFDVEVFCIAELDERSLTEIPVSVRNRPTSSVRLARDTTLLMIDLFRIRRWAGLGVYRRPVPSP